MLIGFAVGLGGGMLAHFLTGGDAPWLHLLMKYLTGPVGQLFLRSLFMLVMPLVFSALVMGIAAMGDIHSMGKVGGKMALFTVFFTGTAVTLGMVLVNIFRPGDGFDPALADTLIAGSADRVAQIVQAGKAAPTGLEIFLGIVPTNVIGAAASNDILGVMFFALVFGLGLVITNTPATARVLEVVDGILDVSMTLINLVIRTAPYAVACLVFNLSAQFGWELLIRLASFVGVTLLAMSIHFFVVYPLLVKFLAKRPPLAFFRGSEEALLLAFSTASSSATLPTTLRVAEQNLKLPERISRFVVTVGATANQNGTALFEGITVLFLAQFYGIDLSFAQQVMVMIVCVLGGIGTAGVPAGSLPVIAMICGMFGIPPEGIGIILGVDRFLDMCRTTVNVGGDLVATAVIARGEPDAPAELQATALPQG